MGLGNGKVIRTTKAWKIAAGIWRELDAMTQRNDHIGALIVIAKAFGYQGSLMSLEQIKLRQERVGHVAHGDLACANETRKHMIRLIEELDPKAANLIYRQL